MPRYWLGIALGGLTLLALVEIGLRTGLIAPEDPRLLAVRDALLAPNPSAAFGDSHVGRDQSLGGRMLFTGFGGATFFEIDRVIAQYYRRLRPERVILAVGPQMFARYRQKTWRQMPAGVFAMQVLPFPLLILEPTLVGAFTQILAPEPHLGAARGRGMSLHQRAFARLLAAQGETAFAAARAASVTPSRDPGSRISGPSPPSRGASHGSTSCRSSTGSNGSRRRSASW